MKRVLRVLLCYVVAFALLWLIGFGWIMDNWENESRIVWFFLGASMVLAAVLALLWELYLHGRDQAQELSKRVDALEAEFRRLDRKDPPET